MKKKKIFPGSKEWATPNYFDNNCYVLSPIECMKRKVGTCWEMTLLSYYNLKKFGFFPYCLYFETTNPRITHSTVCFAYDNAWWLFECAWRAFLGVTKFSSKSDIMDAMLAKTMQKNNGGKKKIYCKSFEADIESILFYEKLTAQVYIDTMREHAEFLDGRKVLTESYNFEF